MTDPKDVSPIFAVEINRDGSSKVVSFLGELDITTAQNMREAFLSPDVTTASSVVVDLTEVTFFDSTAMGLLVAACRRVRDAGGAFSVTCGQSIGRRELEISGLLEYLQVEDSP